MQPTPESYGSTPRRALDVEDYIDIVRRHKAWILGPAFGAMVIAVVIAFLWPDTFISTAVIRVVPPQVPESYVPTNVNMEMSQRINSMAQTILSRGNLTNIINTFNLYQRERQRKPMEDVVEDMRKDIKIGNVVNMTSNRNISAFTVSFSYENRIMAQKVAADLVSRFMSENTRDRTTQSVLTTQFLKDQLDAAKKELDTIESKLTHFRQTNQGRLPEQLQNNQILLNAAESRISNLNGAISRIGQEKQLLEMELRNAKAQQASLTPAADQVSAQRTNEKVNRKQAEIDQWEQNLATMKEHYRETYPDVQRAEAFLARLKKEKEALVKEEEKSAKEEAGKPVPKRTDQQYTRESQAIQAAIDRIQINIKLKDQEAEDYMKEIQNAERQVKNVQSRIESEPVGEQEYQEIVRDRQMAKEKYDDMNRKRSMSAVAEEVEKRQQGESLEVLDPASLPQSPTEPHRPVLIGIGTAIGFVVGIAFAVAREAKDASLKNLKDVRAYTQLTILGSVPLLENDLVVRRRKRLAWLAWSTACTVGVIIMTGSVFYYYTTRV